MKLSEQLRKHLDECGQSMYAVSHQTGIDQASLSKFRLGQRGLSWEAVDAIGELLDLEIVVKSKKRKGADRG
jgi:DNA transposition AAA+ family ATPase